MMLNLKRVFEEFHPPSSFHSIPSSFLSLFLFLQANEVMMKEIREFQETIESIRRKHVMELNEIQRKKASLLTREQSLRRKAKESLDRLRKVVDDGKIKVCVFFNQIFISFHQIKSNKIK